MQNELYRKSPYNIVRLILRNSKKENSVKENRYARAAGNFKSWIKKNILIQDKSPALYIYSQEYTYGQKKIERIGFMGRMSFNGSGEKKSVLPHENTLMLPKLDRLNLLRAVRANLEPIFVLYQDEGHKVVDILKEFRSDAAPFIDTDFENVRHRMWRLQNRRIISKVGSVVGSKEIFIADGHHRYESSRTYSIEIQGKRTPQRLKNSSKFIMAYFAEFNDYTLTILPSHRLIKDIGILKKRDIISKIEAFFYIEKTSYEDAPILKPRASKELSVFGMYLGKGDFYILKLKDHGIVDRLIRNYSEEWRRLDVAVLHLLLIQYVLRIRDDDDNVEFIKDQDEAVRLVDCGKYNIAFILNPTSLSQVARIAKLGERMPRKATYFYPKPLSGLVINKLD